MRGEIDALLAAKRKELEKGRKTRTAPARKDGRAGNAKAKPKYQSKKDQDPEMVRFTNLGREPGLITLVGLI